MWLVTAGTEPIGLGLTARGGRVPTDPPEGKHREVSADECKRDHLQ